MSTGKSTDTDKPAATKSLAAIPVVLTVLATILAGLSSSEMTRSMYFRSLAGQYQAKAGDQWGLFQAKKIRGTTLEAAADLGLLFTVKAFDETMANGLREAIDRAPTEQIAARNPALPAAARALRAALDREEMKVALQFLNGSDGPAVETRPIDDGDINDLLKAIRSRLPEGKTLELVARIPAERIDAAIEIAEANADAFDRACDPLVKSLRQLERAIGDVDRLSGGFLVGSNELKALAGQVHGAALGLRFASQDFTTRRYDREAKNNQQVAELYEAQVRRAGFESERHRLRSRNFFYAMLCAQAGVTIASLALAKSRQSAFWLIAGLAGLIAVAFGGYVYLAM